MAARCVIGLTGNIASGKSEVARMLRELGAEVIDADLVAHETLAPGTPEALAVEARFGSDVLRPDGSVDRTALGNIAFSDPQALADLEAIVHPGTRRRILEQVDRSNAEVAVIEAIKLLEGPLVDHVDVVWVVAARHEVRVQRLVRKRGLSVADAEQRVDAQNPEEDKIRWAAVVLRNEGTLEELRRQVQAAWKSLPGGKGEG